MEGEDREVSCLVCYKRNVYLACGYTCESSIEGKGDAHICIVTDKGDACVGEGCESWCEWYRVGIHWRSGISREDSYWGNFTWL